MAKVEAARWAWSVVLVMTACASLEDPSERPRSELAGAGKAGRNEAEPEPSGSAGSHAFGGADAGRAGTANDGGSMLGGHGGVTSDTAGTGGLNGGGKGGATAGEGGATAGKGGATAGEGGATAGKGGATAGEGGVVGNSAGMGGVAGDGSVAGASEKGGSAGAGGGHQLIDPDACPSAKAVKGATYYACSCADGAASGCVPGTGDGSSPEQALGTYDELRLKFSTLKAGDAVAFCRGGSFVAGSDRNWDNSNCTADAPCTIRDYTAPWGDGTEKAPSIDAGNGHAFFFKVWQEQPEHGGFQVLNLAIHGGPSSVGVGAEGALSDLLMCGLSLHDIETGVRLMSDGAEMKRIQLRSSRVQRAAYAAFSFASGDCGDCAIEDNDFEGNPFDNITFWGPGPHTNLRIARNDILNIGAEGQLCRVSAIMVNAHHDGLLIEDNHVELAEGGAETECKGINVSTDDQVTTPDVVIRNNYLKNLGGHPLVLQYCDDCVIENNVVVSSRAAPTEAIWTGVTAGLKVRNNTVFFTASSTNAADISAAFQFYYSEASEVANNLIWHAGSSPGFSCFRGLVPSKTQFPYSDHNGCYAPGIPAAHWAEGYGNLVAWQKAPGGFDAHSFAEEPGLDADLRPASASAYVVGKGDAEHGAPHDADGTPRHDPPDVGAYEH